MALSWSLDSRNENIQIDYNALKYTVKPDFTNGFTSNGQTYQTFYSTGSVAPNGTVVAFTLNTLPSHSYLIEAIASGFVTAVNGGTDLGKAMYELLYEGAANNAGTVTATNLQVVSALNGITAGTGVTTDVVGTTMTVSFTGNATDTINYSIFLKVYYN